MWLFIGLGNPEDSYAHTRHNAGFMAVDSISARFGFPPFRKKFQGLIAQGQIADTPVLLLKPLTYMNLSGESAAPAARFYKIPPQRIVVFHDDLDLPAHHVRIKCGGGNAGHNGLKSLDQTLGTPAYWRVRLGIGHPGARDKVHAYVLGDIPKAEQPAWQALFTRLAECAPILVSSAPQSYAGACNAAPPPAVP